MYLIQLMHPRNKCSLGEKSHNKDTISTNWCEWAHKGSVFLEQGGGQRNCLESWPLIVEDSRT